MSDLRVWGAVAKSSVVQLLMKLFAGFHFLSHPKITEHCQWGLLVMLVLDSNFATAHVGVPQAMRG